MHVACTAGGVGRKGRKERKERKKGKQEEKNEREHEGRMEESSTGGKWESKDRQRKQAGEEEGTRDSITRYGSRDRSGLGAAKRPGGMQSQGVIQPT